MTLLATEIHNHDSPNGAFIVFAADRRISRNGSYCATRKKVFRLDWLTAGIGYFGLAEVSGTRRSTTMQDWLEGLIRKSTHSRTLEEFAKDLAASLNTAVPRKLCESQRSGFHIAGFNTVGQPEFWFLGNLDEAGEPTLKQYEAREDFQRRDALRLQPGDAMIYRNGDIRAHEAAWGKIDDSFGPLLRSPDFRELRTPEDYMHWVRFKMELIAYFYKHYHPKPIVARPIDAFSVQRK